MRTAIPKLYVTDCRHIQITKDISTGNVEIDFDTGAMIVLAMGRPELKIVETSSQAGENDEQTPEGTQK